MAAQPATPHRHAWRFSSYTGPWARLTITDRCRCGQNRRRNATRREAQLLKRSDTASKRKFAVLYEFCRHFQNKGGTWKYHGNDLMTRIERWAKRYPDRVHLVDTDDAHHMQSFLCVIERATGNYWMGLTVYNIPQCVVAPDEFFLYPEYHDHLAALLKKLARKRDRIKKRQHSDERRFWRAMHAACPKPRS